MVAFGGDGTVNEVVNGLAGTDTPLSVLPGGATQRRTCRMLGIPNDVVDATEHLLAAGRRLGAARGRRRASQRRWFTFSAGVGLDASVVERVDRHPELKAKHGPWYYAGAAVGAFLSATSSTRRGSTVELERPHGRRAYAPSSRTASRTRTSSAGR